MGSKPDKKQNNQLKIRRCTLQCESDLGQNMQKYSKNMPNVEPKWEQKSRRNEKNTWNVARATWNGDKSLPERLQEQSGGKGAEPFRATLGENSVPWVTSGTPWASIMAPKIEKCRQKCDPEIGTEKVLKNDAKFEGKWNQK